MLINICINIEVLAFFGYLAFWTVTRGGNKLKVYFIRFFFSVLMDGSVPQVTDAGLSQGPAVAGSHIAGSAAVGSFVATAPMLVELKSFLSNELCSFKEELKRQNDESINSAVKKMRLENSACHSFKSKGNEEQYIHQEKVATCFDNAIQALHSGKLHEVRNRGR